MNFKDLQLLRIAQKPMSLKAFSKTPVAVFGTRHSCALWGGFLNANIKYFHITDNTRTRLSSVPVENLTGDKLIDLQNERSSGFVYFNDGLHFLYHIRNNGVYIMTSSQKSQKIVNDPEFYMSQTMDGFIYIDFNSKDLIYYINSIFDAMSKSDHLLLKERSTLTLLKKIRDDSSGDVLKKLQEDNNAKFEKTKLCLQAFMFIHFAKIIQTTRVSEENDTRTFSERLAKKPIQKFDIVQVDTFYDETMKVINPFGVSGHFRNQPIGKARSEKKMIYIDSFMKTGYTRVATKEKIKL